MSNKNFDRLIHILEKIYPDRYVAIHVHINSHFDHENKIRKPYECKYWVTREGLEPLSFQHFTTMEMFIDKLDAAHELKVKPEAVQRPNYQPKNRVKNFL